MIYRTWAIGSSVLALIILASTFAWLQRQPLIDTTLRPWLCNALSVRLDGDFQIERIELESDRVVLNRLKFQRGEEFELSFPSTELTFSPWQLLQGRLTSVKFTGPEVSINRWPESETRSPPPSLSRPWLEIETVTVQNGSLAAVLGTKVLHVDQLNLTAGLTSTFPVRVTGQVGIDSRLPVTIQGHGSWTESPRLTIEAFIFDGSPLLVRPVTLAPGLVEGRVSLGLDRLDAAMADRVLEAAGESRPWPPEADWTLNQARIELTWGNDMLQGKVTASDGRARLDERVLNLKRLEFTLAGQEKNWVAEATIDLPGTSRFALGITWEKGLLKGTWELASIDPTQLSKGLVRRFDNAPQLRNIALSGQLRWSDAGFTLPSLRLRGELEGQGWKGGFRADAKIDRYADAWRITLHQLTADDLEFFSADGLSGWTGGTLRLAGSLEIGARTSFTVNGEINLTEALLGNWYGELADLPLHFNLRGQRTEPGLWQLVQGELSLAQLVTADLTAETDLRSGRLGGRIAVVELGGDFSRQVKKHGSFALSQLNHLVMAGGLEAEGNLRWTPTGRDLNIAIQLQHAGLRLGSDLVIRNIDGTVPLIVREPGLATGQEKTGRLTWESFEAGPLHGEETGITLTASPNRLLMHETLPLQLAGGELNLFEATLGWDESPFFKTSARLSGVKLGALSEDLGWPPLNGLLEAELRGIRYSNDRLSLDGGASANLFGGRVELSNMSVRSPFAAHPLFRLDVDFSGIDLLQLTETFAFGEMNGIADGYIHHLELFGTTPSTFQARFETRTSGTRNISVKALNNINTLSQGGLSAALSQGIYQFIDFYRYRKIGLLCSLKNDLFQVQGTARETDPRYLIEGSLLPPRIDVLVSSPTISFKEMVRRLQRIERTER